MSIKRNIDYQGIQATTFAIKNMKKSNAQNNLGYSKIPRLSLSELPPPQHLSKKTVNLEQRRPRSQQYKHIHLQHIIYLLTLIY